jgi:3-phenylpropionate/trans-cinnamate dioxygenase ferredoxin reductase subunit
MSMVGNETVVIVGAGHAGGTAAAMLRQYGHLGPIVLLGDEPVAPYQRPPLSKEWLRGEADHSTLALKPLSFYAEQGIEFRPAVRAERLDREGHKLFLSDGSELTYDKLILATGARAISLALPGAELEGILFLRNAVDAEKLKLAVGPGKRVVVVGGGYIGLEVAASSRSLGSEVIVLERESRLLARVACAVLGTFFRKQHEARGVGFELGCNVVGFEGDAGRVSGVLLGDGRVIPCDAVVIGVGAVPNDEIAAESGLETARGVVVDQDARSISDSDIFAIGDVARRPMPIYSRMASLESVHNALEQAKQAASAITDRPRPAGECPWQWSDQFDIRLQIAGHPFDVDDVVVRGDPESSKFAVFHLSSSQIQAVEAINASPEFIFGRQLILSRKAVDKVKLADPACSMKEVAR